MSRVRDSELYDPRPKRGQALLFFVLSLVLLAIGLALDFLRPHQPVFWLGALTGAPALIGAGAAILVVAIGRLARLVLTRRVDEDGGA